ncbi:MAG: hypothetical protein FJ315_09355, partial [SAR202 cluster bacterium]|nr:hypothetical protein [SAR202 cluster bacterium]
MTTPLDLSQDAATPWRVVYSGLQFPGEVVVGGDWRDRYGEALPAGLSFRVAFLRSHAALHPPALAKGVVVAMPSPRPSPEAQQATRQLGALREVQAGYLTSTSSELRALGRSLAREEQKAAARLHTDLARAYASGAIVASTAVRGDAGAVFGLPGPTAWADSLAGAVLGVVHPQTPIAPSLLTRPVTPADVRPLLSVVSGSSDASSGGDAAMLLPGLRLRRQDLEHSPVLEFVQAAIKRGGKLGVVALLDELSQSLGLPRYLAPVFIVAYIARNRPASELDLMDSHEITHRSGAPFLGDRLSWDVLSDIAWPEDLERRVVALGPAQPPTSRSPLPYGVEL